MKHQMKNLPLNLQKLHLPDPSTFLSREFANDPLANPAENEEILRNWLSQFKIMSGMDSKFPVIQDNENNS